MNFKLGTLLSTNGVQNEINFDEVLLAFERYMKCDWGDLCDEDKEANNNALIYNERIFAKYRDSKNKEFYIITEWDRSHTTILLVEEY